MDQSPRSKRGEKNNGKALEEPASAETINYPSEEINPDDIPF